jgi:hypothetical protein
VRETTVAERCLAAAMCRCRSTQRALEKWGVVERSPYEGDARNRPWKASGTSLRIDSSQVGPAVRDVMADQLLAGLSRRLREHRERSPQERTGSTALSSGELWLTSEQAERLSVSFENALLDEHETGWRNEPGPGRIRMAFLWSLLPDPLPGDPHLRPGDTAAEGQPG